MVKCGKATLSAILLTFVILVILNSFISVQVTKPNLLTTYRIEDLKTIYILNSEFSEMYKQGKRYEVEPAQRYGGGYQVSVRIFNRRVDYYLQGERLYVSKYIADKLQKRDVFEVNRGQSKVMDRKLLYYSNIYGDE